MCLTAMLRIIGVTNSLELESYGVISWKIMVVWQITIFLLRTNYSKMFRILNKVFIIQKARMICNQF